MSWLALSVSRCIFVSHTLPVTLSLSPFPSLRLSHSLLPPPLPLNPVASLPPSFPPSLPSLPISLSLPHSIHTFLPICFVASLPSYLSPSPHTLSPSPSLSFILSKCNSLQLSSQKSLQFVCGPTPSPSNPRERI